MALFGHGAFGWIQQGLSGSSLSDGHCIGLVARRNFWTVDGFPILYIFA
jgi:hypothetical protein